MLVARIRPDADRAGRKAQLARAPHHAGVGVAARVAIVVVGIVVAHVEMGVDLHDGHLARPAAAGMGLERADRDRVDAAEDDREPRALRDRLGDPRDHRRGC